MKKILNVLTIMLMVVTLLPMQANMNKVMAVTGDNWIDVADTSWYTTDTSLATFTISTAEQLAGLAKLVNDTTFDSETGKLNSVDFFGKTINLSSDIELSGKYWTPIGDYSWYNTALDGWSGVDYKLPFKGTFNGNGKIISNILINASKDGVGLFGYGDSAALNDLNIENVAITASGYEAIGSLVGILEMGSVSNVHVNGSINITSNRNRVGGLVGSLEGSQISNSSVIALSVSIITGSQEVGGLVGGTSSSEDNTGNPVKASIETSNTDVSVESSDGQVGGMIGLAYDVDVSKSFSIGSVFGYTNNVGGFIGELGQNNEVSTVTNCYATGFARLGPDHGDYSAVGGFIGLNGGSITNAYSVGEVISEGDVNAYDNDKIGGFVGFDNWGNGTVSNGYWDITTSHQEIISGLETSAQGQGMTTADMKNKDKFTGFDFSTIWSIKSGATISYPFFTDYAQSPAPGLETAAKTWIDYRDTAWPGSGSGSGSYTDPYIISSAKELAALAYAVNVEGKYSSNSYTPTYFKLFTTSTSVDNRVIDLKDHNWTPIGTTEHPFIAYFNGNLATIDHMTINSPDTDNVGLFGVTGLRSVTEDSNNSVENLYLTNVDVIGQNYVGALVGRAYKIKVNNVKVNGSIKGTDNVGGLIGRSESFNPFDDSGSYNSVQLSGFSGDIEGSTKVGGLIGSMLKTMPRFSYAEVHITVPNKASDIGGLVGRAEGGKIWQTYSRGQISGGNELTNVGQLVGYNNRMVLNNLSSIDLELGTNLTNASGLIGFSDLIAWQFPIFLVDNYATTLSELKLSMSQFDKLNFFITDDLTKVGANFDTYAAACKFFIKSGVDTPRLWFELRNMSYPTPSWKGLGTATSPYLISSVKELQELATFTNKGDGFEDKYFELSSSIDISSISDWTPIGSETSPFKGIFDGNNQTITGLNIPANDGVYLNNAGLFGVTGPKAKFFDLTLKDVDVNGRENVGGLVGKANGSDFENIAIDGHVYGTSMNIGGIIGNFASGSTDGSNTGGNLLKSHFIGTIGTNGEVSNVGGLVGYNVRGVNMSYAEVTLLPGMFSNDIGGLVGYNKEGEIMYSYSIGSMESKGSTNNVGGLVGHHEKGLDLGLISMSYALMDFITIEGDANFGGLVGKNAPDSNGSGLGPIDSSFSSGTINGVLINPNGLIGLNNDSSNPTSSWQISLENLQKLKTFLDENWPILLKSAHDGTDPKTNTSGTTAIWYLDAGSDTPRLWYQRGPKSSSNDSNNSGGSSIVDSGNTSTTPSTVTNSKPVKVITKPVVKPAQNNQELVVEYGSQDLNGKIKLPELGSLKSLKVELVNKENSLGNSTKKKVVDQLDLEGKQLLLDLQAQVQLSATTQDGQNSVQNLTSDDLLAPITLTLPIPNGAKAEEVQVIRIQNDGSYEVVAAKIVTINNAEYYSLETTDLGNYGLTSPIAALNDVVKVGSGLALIWYFVYGSIALLAGWFFWFILFKRRKKEEEEEELA